MGGKVQAAEVYADHVECIYPYLCEACGTNIPLARLNALPYATCCIKCQREAERQGAGNRADVDWSRLLDSSSHDADVSISDIAPRDLAIALARGGVDVAVDLVGHGHGCVLDALAYRPAPLQITWLDYVATTGVAAINARISSTGRKKLSAASPAHGTG